MVGKQVATIVIETVVVLVQFLLPIVGFVHMLGLLLVDM